MALYTIFNTGLNGPIKKKFSSEERKSQAEFLPDNIYNALEHFQGSAFIKEMLGEANQEKYGELKMSSAERCPRALGTLVKTEEILFHHEVTNQYIWKRF